MQTNYPKTLEPAVELAGDIDTATLELLARWQREDATDDPELMSAGEREVAKFKKMMNENRSMAGERIVYP